jgi:hypothetical protein
LKLAGVAFSALNAILLIPNAARSSTFCLLRMFMGVIMICMPSSLNSKGIQNVKVFPAPVAAMETMSPSWQRIASTTQICQQQGQCPNNLKVFSLISRRDDMWLSFHNFERCERRDVNVEDNAMEIQRMHHICGALFTNVFFQPSCRSLWALTNVWWQNIKKKIGYSETKFSQ